MPRNNNVPQNPIRTSLRAGGDLGQNRLATGFGQQSQSRRNADKKQASTHPSDHQDIVEVSDDSELEEGEEREDDEEDSEGGILLNIDAVSQADSCRGPETPIEVSSSVDEGMIDENMSNERPQHLTKPRRTLHGADGNVSGSSNCPVNPSPRGRILADLSPADLEAQIRYTLFHLRRDQIDLGRPVVCLACLNEGHTDQACPDLTCSNCDGQTRHSNRLCPRTIRCARCGDRGHDADNCMAKLKNLDLEPCELCRGTDHVEASCTERFFPQSQIPLRSAELQLWISCGQCGSKEHLAGDCYARGSRLAHPWSLRNHSHRKIVNLSLQTGAQKMEKEAQSKGLRPEGGQIGGRGAGRRNDKQASTGGRTANSSSRFESKASRADKDDDDEDVDFTTRLATRNPQHTRFPNTSRNNRHDRFSDDDGDNDANHNRPRSNHNHSHSQSQTRYPRRRPRSRSPSPSRYEIRKTRPAPPPLPPHPPPHPRNPAPPTTKAGPPTTSQPTQPLSLPDRRHTYTPNQQPWPSKPQNGVGASRHRGDGGGGSERGGGGGGGGGGRRR